MTDAGATTRAFAAGERSAREIVEEALARIAAENVALNAFTEVLAARALERAAQLDEGRARKEECGPLAAVPFAAKNLFDVAGVVTRAGAAITRTHPPAPRDAEAISAWEAAGAILVGCTNMDEFAYGFVTENAHDGPTRNPHDRSRIAGGSSGGSAAAVGGGLVPLALGTDTNGSVRVPAALCGIFGCKPAFGTVSRHGVYPFVDSLDHVGHFARTAADLRAAYFALPGAGMGEAPASAPRVARLGGHFARDLTPEASAAVDRVAEGLGVTEQTELPEAARAREAAFVITAAEGGALHLPTLRTRYAEYDPATRDRLIAGALVPAVWVERAHRFRRWFREEVARVLVDIDVVLAPATPYPATPIGAKTTAVGGVEVPIRPNLGLFTQPISFIGLPALVVPVTAPGALPLGVQLIGKPGAEATLFALAERLEADGICVAR